MQLLLSSKLLYLSRDEWDESGAPRLGAILNNDEAVEAIQHHTVGADYDNTPNRWTTLDEVKNRMRFLRTIRPDLGADVPYSWVGFFMEDQVFGEGGMIVCEGRGPDRRGAHTRYHNRTGRAMAIAGNLEDRFIDVLPFVPQLSRFWSFAKYEQGLPNLGTVKPERGEIWPHREFPTASTVCPGKYMMRVLRGVRMTPPPEEEDDMAQLWLLKKKGTNYTFVSNGFERSHVKSATALKELQDAGVWPKEIIEVSGDALDQIPTI